ncbi:hypothetical protein [Psychrobacter cryohalolentis]|uniref:Uncharacterized protein n=1 Tax=Psychrobacter cryohalolentis (strain ATCC BAA-1226 / DSM 17306 / VKM B-2378 / K5) TaxID=335284 RepID=Q1QA47_PSYCK|nr:hypothetical protein [Psychrobacter cryohalolentis]ABE75456.1 conserved hypothetical protein [Psychrobacter cryohalolentis K5]ASE25647.1 hypothetical protein CEP87_03285 [Psychrobacter cryohalolentis]
MRFKSVLRFCSPPARPSCQDSVSYKLERSLHCSFLNTETQRSVVKHYRIARSQQGASTLVLALFVIAILVTAIVALVFGHKLGYQRGYYSMQNETQQAVITSKESLQELKDLRVSHKIATNEVATSKQELEISLANLKELRENQQAIMVENRQVAQLNDLYAEIVSEKGGMPLQILGAKIEPLPENAFEYGFDIGMLASDGKAKRLNPTLTLLDDDDFVEVPLEPVSYTIEGVTRIRGRFTMPAGFKPLQIKLNLKAAGQEVEQLYDWKLGAKVDNMPLSLLDLPDVDESPIEP